MSNVILKMLITLNDDGQVSIECAETNKIALYGLLGAAHDAIKDYYDSNKIVPARILPISKLSDKEN